jgi:two-component system chemotaxis sensor kinase CheA
VEKLHGRIEMKSLPGKGTAVTISLPLTFAIISGMVVQTGEEEYIIPAAAVREAFRPRKENLVNAGQPGEMVNVRGRQIPLVRLHGMLGIRPRTEDPCQATVILVENKGRRACLMADHLAGQKQILIKNPGGMFSSIRGIADATVLGSGKVGLIIDVEGLLDRALKAE